MLIGATKSTKLEDLKARYEAAEAEYQREKYRQIDIKELYSGEFMRNLKLAHEEGLLRDFLKAAGISLDCSAA